MADYFLLYLITYYCVTITLPMDQVLVKTFTIECFYFALNDTCFIVTWYLVCAAVRLIRPTPAVTNTAVLIKEVKEMSLSKRV